MLLAFWSCEDDTPTEVTLWGIMYSVEDTEYLDLTLNQLTGSIPSEIGNLRSVNKLILNQNQLTGSIPPEISELNYLNQLDLSYNQLTGSIPPEIGNLPRLYNLKLSYNQLTGDVPESICDLYSNDSPCSYELQNNQLCPPYPYCVENWVANQDTSNCD